MHETFLSGRNVLHTCTILQQGIIIGLENSQYVAEYKLLVPGILLENPLFSFANRIHIRFM